MNTGVVIVLFGLVGLIWFVGNFYLASKIDADNAKMREKKAEEERGKSEALLGMPMTQGEGENWDAYRRGYVKGLVDIANKSNQ